MALVAVAPLVLCAYFADRLVSPAMAWLVFLAAIWAFMAPCRREEEEHHPARRRVLRGTLADPFFWSLVVFALYSAVVAVNSGVAMVFDTDTLVWRLSAAAAPVLPGSAASAGLAFFAAALAAAALYPAIVHSLDSRRASDFALLASALVLLRVIFNLACGSAAGVAVSPTAYGWWSLIALAAMLAAVRVRDRFSELVAMAAFAGCLLATALGGRPLVTSAFAAAALLLVTVAVIGSWRELRWRGAVRSLLLFLVALLAFAVCYHWLSGDWTALVPKALRSASDAVLDRLAFDAAVDHPWIGVGAGAFPFAAKLGATPSDWTVLGAVPDFGSGALRVFLVERGMIGSVMLLIAAGALVYAWFRRAYERGRAYFTAAVALLPIALVTFAFLSVFDGSGLRTEALVAFAALAAFSVNGGK